MTTENNTKDYISGYAEHYFDWAATSPEDSAVLHEALELAVKNFANPSSQHSAGKNARKLLEEARSRSADVLNVKKEQVFFTSGGTESDHIPLLSVLSSSAKNGRIILSAVEHPALREQCAVLSRLGFDVVTVFPDKNGFITAQSIAEKITTDTLFISVMAVNNETGCIQPVYEIADAVTKAAEGKRKPHFHVDCVQAAGKIPLNLSYKGIDSAALSAHKIMGPRGIGLLYLSKPIKPFLTGGGQEGGIRSGTENLFGAIAFSKCLEKYFIVKDTPSYERFTEQKKRAEDFIKSLSQINTCTLVPEVRADLTAEIQDRFSPWVIQAAFRGIPGNVMVRALDAKGFYISTGSACSSKKQSRPILAAMNVSREIQDTAVRFSFGPSTTEKAMQELFQAVKEITEEFN